MAGKGLLETASAIGLRRWLDHQPEDGVDEKTFFYLLEGINAERAANARFNLAELKRMEEESLVRAPERDAQGGRYDD